MEHEKSPETLLNESDEIWEELMGKYWKDESANEDQIRRFRRND